MSSTNNLEPPAAPVSAPASAPATAVEKDIWRDTALRYAGYCNEVGEAFAPIYPRFLIPSYVVSVMYVLGNTYVVSVEYVLGDTSSKVLSQRQMQKPDMVNAFITIILIFARFLTSYH